MLADDFKAHLTTAVFRLCWTRGYVFIPLGGGVTGNVQTVDLDLNQHVRRMYCAEEAAELIDQMRRGVGVPSMKPEQCIDILHRVMSNQKLHLEAAESYVKAGWKALLDDSGRDELICREARATWQSKGMREKVNAAGAEVRCEARANRLRWTPTDICRLIKPYPAHKDVDKQLQKLAADAFVDAGDPAGEGVEELQDDRGVDQDGDTEQDEEEILECKEM